MKEIYYTYGGGRLSRMAERLLQAMFPMGTYCICCGKYIDITRTYCICDECMNSINWGPIYIDLPEERKKGGRTAYLDSALSCMVYGLHSKRMIFNLKYDGKTFMSRPLSMILFDRLSSDESLGGLIERLDMVVPVPLHSERLKTRGFNQAALLSGGLTRRLNSISDTRKIRHIPECLVRTKQTAEQRSVSGSSRYSNLEDAFRVNAKYMPLVRDSAVLLVDDIFTTGATADRCARELKGAGAKEVHFLSLATGNYWLRGSYRERDDEDFLHSMLT